MLNRYFIILIFLIKVSFLNGQSVPYSILFDDELLHEIFITMNADSLEEMYDELENEHEYVVQFIYKTASYSDTLQQVGFRLRGNTSLGSAKKSFKLSFNTYNAGRKFEKVEKLNLIGNHNDPSMSREKIYFDIYNQFGLPTRRVSFVKLFINGDYFGLYTNVEEYDEIFLKDRFGENSGNFYKCLYGSNLEYNGDNASDYPSYELQSGGSDYSDLIHLVDILNHTSIELLPCALEKIFNVDQFLKIYAIDISTGHWDNYGANQNNYFLYHNQFSNQFEFLSYDCDNVLGVDWLGIDWSNRELNSWNFDNRPLIEKLMQVPEYKDRFNFYLNTLIQTILLPENINPHIDSIKNLITTAALEDEFKGYDWGYSDDDFLNSFSINNIDGHTPFGVMNFIDARYNNSIDQLDLNAIAPFLNTINHNPPVPAFYEQITFQAKLTEDFSIVNVTLYFSENTIVFDSVELFDDGLHEDNFSDDYIFGNLISGTEYSTIYYYISAIDNSGNRSRFPICDAFQLRIGKPESPIRINEILASNNFIVSDEAGDFSDYIELINITDTNVFLGNYFLSDDFENPTKWKLPNQYLEANAYLLIWADNEVEESDLHCDFKLNADGEQIGIFSSVETYFSPLDTLSFGLQSTDVSFGRIPNATGPFVYLNTPSPNQNNEFLNPPVDSIFANEFYLVNHPSANTQLYLSLQSDQNVFIEMYALSGEKISVIQNQQMEAGTYLFELANEQLSREIYILKILIEDTISNLLYFK